MLADPTLRVLNSGVVETHFPNVGHQDIGRSAYHPPAAAVLERYYAVPTQVVRYQERTVWSG